MVDLENLAIRVGKLLDVSCSLLADQHQHKRLPRVVKAHKARPASQSFAIRGVPVFWGMTSDDVGYKGPQRWHLRDLACLFQSFPQQLARRADERRAAKVFGSPRGFADQHQVAGQFPRPDDDLSPMLTKFAFGASRVPV